MAAWAAEPVISGEGGKMMAASEKVNPALRADFAKRAGFFDPNPNIAEAMVDKDIILVERFGKKKVLKLDSEDQIKKAGPNPDVIISPKGKLLTLDAKELVKYGVADFLLPPTKIGFITEGERKRENGPQARCSFSKTPSSKKSPMQQLIITRWT